MHIVLTGVKGVKRRCETKVETEERKCLLSSSHLAFMLLLSYLYPFIFCPTTSLVPYPADHLTSLRRLLYYFLHVVSIPAYVTFHFLAVPPTWISEVEVASLPRCLPESSVSGRRSSVCPYVRPLFLLLFPSSFCQNFREESLQDLVAGKSLKDFYRTLDSLVSLTVEVDISDFVCR